MDSFTYDAPRFFDFANGLCTEDEQHTEAFFEVEHESHNGTVPIAKPSISPDVSQIDSEQEFYTPFKVPTHSQFAENGLRKSLSVTNLMANPEDYVVNGNDTNVIINGMADLQVSISRKKRMSKSVSNSTRSRKTHVMNTRADVPKLNLRSRSISKEHLDQLAQPKQKQENVGSKRFVSMAEAISQFHQKTPKRFHTKSKTEPVSTVKLNGPIPSTVPHSPALSTKQRARPTHFLPREERELKEYEEAQKFKIKPNQVNMKMLQGAIPLKVPAGSRKSPTKLEPFNITQSSRKVPQSPQAAPLFEFHARAVPKAVLAAPKPIIKSSLYTVPNTPRLLKRYYAHKPKTEDIPDGCNTTRSQPFKLTGTIPKPFSFAKRDENVMKHREKLLQEIMEEEKKAREFHARPVPKRVLESPQRKVNTTIYQKREKSDSSLYKSMNSLPETTTTTFKARPAKVLQMKPFVPKLPDHHSTDITEFHLNTTVRAQERATFEEKLRDREQQIAAILRERNNQKMLLEQEEARRIRKETEYKAQPIRRYKDVKPVAAKPLTDPVSPKFTALKNNHNKENLA